MLQLGAKQVLARAVAGLASLIFPSHCLICGKPLEANEKHICSACEDGLPSTMYEMFAKNPVEEKFVGILKIHSAFSAYHYTHGHSISKLVYQFKYHGNRDLAVEFGRKLGELMKVRKFHREYDFLVPVPLHKKKLAARGYNQCSLIAQGISEVTGMPINETLLVRIKHLSSQTKKSQQERMDSASMSYGLGENPEKWNGVRLLLVDDVLTTGATIESCCNVLMQIKNVRLGFVTVCCARR